MPTYDYGCPICGHTKEVTHSIKESPEILCDKCCNESEACMMERLITATPNFIIKGGSPSIHWKEKRLRMKNREKLKIKEIERYGSGPQATPNVDGVVVDSWSDATKLAKDKGKNLEGYKKMAQAEKNTSKSSNVDDRKWKEAKQGYSK